MKKISVLFVLTLLMSLTACLIQEEYDPIGDVLDSLSITAEAYDDFDLVVVKENVELSWSSNSNAIVIDESKAKVTQGKNDTEVTLTVDAKKGELTGSKSFDLKVIKDLTFPDTVTMTEAYSIADNSFVLLEKVTAIESSSVGTYFTDGENVILATDLKNIEINKVYDLKGMKITSGVATLQNCSVYDTTGDISNITPKNTTPNNIGFSNGYFRVTGELKYEDNILYLFDQFESIILTSDNIDNLKLFVGSTVSIDLFSRGTSSGYTYATELDLGLTDVEILNVFRNNISVAEYSKINIELPDSFYSSTITWSSNNSIVLSNSGIVNRQSSDTSVTLTATLKLNSQTITKQFNVVVINVNNNYEDDLFISEYYEGASNNKYIEIYNPNDFAVDLSDYSLKTRCNGKDEYDYNNSLTGQIAAYSTVIYHHNSITSDFIDILNENNVVYYTATACNFTGNDTIGLYLDGEIIDLFGVYNEVVSESWVVPGGTTQNHRIIRNKTTGASTLWNPSEWYASSVSSSSMFFDNAGKHSFV